MANIWVTSDSHFGYSNIIKYCDRPFKDVKEMDECLTDNWNETVKPGDKVYHLGDVYFPKGKSPEYWGWFFSRLNGSKRLILGNHDDGKDKILYNTFNKIMVWRMFPEMGLLLTHIPVHPRSLGILVSERHDLEEGSCGDNIRQLTNIHGHIHQNDAYSNRYINVCVEKTKYKPVNIEELRVK